MRMRCGRQAAAILLVALLMVTGAVAQTSDDENERQTKGGLLSIEKSETDSGRHFRVLLDKTVLYGDEESESVEIQYVYPSKEPVVLALAFFSGGTACPALFRFVDVTAPEGRRISEEFGNCAPYPKFSVAGSVLTARFPSIGGAKAKVERWDFASHGIARTAAAKNAGQAK